MGEAKPLPHTSELHSGLSVPTARSLYSECIGVERASLEAWTRYTRVLFTRLVQSGRFIPSILREVLVAVVVFRGEQLTGAIGKAMDEARLLVDWKLGRVPKTNGDATISCDSCTAPLTRVTNRDARSRGYCDCCQRLAVFINAKNKWTARLCASCAHADPSVLDKLQPPSRFQAMSALLGPLQALSGVVPHANGDAVDPTRHTLKEELKLWKRRQKTLRGAHVQVFKIAKRVFNYSHDKYAEELEVKRGFCSAMEAYVAYLLAKAAEQGVPNCLSLHSAALMLYGGCTPPCHAKPYLQELPIASKNAQQQPPCTRCNAALDHPARVDSFSAFCDCCERVLPLAAVVADSTRDGGTSRCLVCHTVSESTDGDQSTLPSRIDSTWLHQLNKRVKKLGNKLVKSVKVELQRATKLLPRHLQTCEGRGTFSIADTKALSQTPPQRPRCCTRCTTKRCSMETRTSRYCWSCWLPWPRLVTIRRWPSVTASATWSIICARRVCRLGRSHARCLGRLSLETPALMRTRACRTTPRIIKLISTVAASVMPSKKAQIAVKCKIHREDLSIVNVRW